MMRIYLTSLVFALGCGGGGSDGVPVGGDAGGGDAGGGDAGGGDAGAGNDGGGGDAGGGDGGGADGGGEAGEAADPLVPLASVLVPEGVTAATLSADGNALLTCEGGLPKSRSMSELTQVSDHDGDCPEATAKGVTIGTRTVTAAGPRGLKWADGQVDAQAPVYSLAPTSDPDHAVTASWDALYLWDLGDPDGDYQRGRQVLDSGPVMGVVSAGAGQVVAWGPDGLSLVAVDPGKQGPDVKVDSRSLTVLCYDDGTCEGGIVLQNGGGAPLDIYEATIEGDGLTVEVIHSGFDEPPEGVLARAHGIAGALITVRLEGGNPATETRHRLLLKTNDVDEPDFELSVITGEIALRDGEDAPDFRFPDLDGEVHQLSALLGKVVHIKYLNAACVSCREAIPVLEEGIWTPLRGEEPDFVPFVVHVGRGTRFAATTNEELNVLSPMLLDLDGAHYQAASQVANGSLAYPLALLVDKQGKVRHLIADVEPTPEEWRAWIDALLAE